MTAPSASAEAGLEGRAWQQGREPLGTIRILDQGNRPTGRALARISSALMAEHDDHQGGLRCQRGIDRVLDQALALELDQQLVASHPARFPGGQHDGGDARPRRHQAADLGARQRPARDLGQEAADAEPGHLAQAPTGRSASRRCSTQSKPLSLGERAQPGRPSTGTAPMCPTSIRLPGSTGMPKLVITPSAASIPAGMTSRRSTMAEAPAISTSFGATGRAGCGSPSATAVRRDVRDPLLGQQASQPSAAEAGAPGGLERSCRARSPSGRAAGSGSARPGGRGTALCAAALGLAAPRRRAPSSGAAKGMILKRVATIWRGATGA